MSTMYGISGGWCLAVNIADKRMSIGGINMLKYLTVAAALVATTATAQTIRQNECYDAVPFIQALAESGYVITFGDTSYPGIITFLLSHQNGRWVMIDIKNLGATACITNLGEFGVFSLSNLDASA